MSAPRTIFDIIGPEEYTQFYSEEPVKYDVTRFNDFHAELDKLMRTYWNYFHPLIRDILFSFSHEFNKLVNVINVAELEVNQNNQKITELQNHINVLEGGTDELNANHLILKQEINRILDQNERLKWKVKAAELEQQEINQKLTKTLKENFEYRKQINDLSEGGLSQVIDIENSPLAQENEMLNNELVKIYEEKESLERVNLELKQRISQLEEQITHGETPEVATRGVLAESSGSPLPNEELTKLHSSNKNRELESENKYLNEKIVEVLNVNKQTATLINILIEMRKQMLVLQKEVKKSN